MEKYLTGDLAEGEQQRLEEHLLTCEDCREHLGELSLLRACLEKEQWRVADERSVSRPQWHWALAAVAALVFVGVVLWPRLADHPGQEDGVIARLSAVEAPPYEPNKLRTVSGEGDRLFREAMAAYQESALEDAVSGLEAAVELDPELARAHFYLGACYLLTDQPEMAIDSLSQVVDVEDPQYLEWAYLYRAKAYLRIGDLESARSDLEEVVMIRGELVPEAQGILEQLPD